MLPKRGGAKARREAPKMACVSARVKVSLEIAIILAIAAAVEFLPGGHATLEAFYAAVWATFGVGLYFVCMMQYRERKMSLYALGDGRRALLYGTIAALVVTLAAKDRMWETGLGEFVWFAIVGLSIYTFVALYRWAHRY
jgi:hypothetical protein